MRCDVQDRKPKAAVPLKMACAFCDLFLSLLIQHIPCAGYSSEWVIYMHQLTSLPTSPMRWVHLSPHFTEEENATQRGQLSCLSSRGQPGIELGSSPRLPGSRVHPLQPLSLKKLKTLKRSDACSEKGTTGFSRSIQQGHCI